MNSYPKAKRLRPFRRPRRTPRCACYWAFVRIPSKTPLFPCNGHDATRSEMIAGEGPGAFYAFIASIATSVRFFAFSFLMILRTWTFTVLKHMFNS
jgi:hypothetical protein